MARRLLILATLLLAVSVTPAWAHDRRGLTPRLDQPDAVVAPLLPSRVPDVTPVTPPSESAVTRPPRVGAPAGAVERLAVLSVALGLAGFTRACRRDRRAAVASATAGLLVGFVVGTTPHLVHHSLEADQGADCQTLQAAERSSAAVGAPDAVPAEAFASLDEPSSFVAGPSLFAPAPHGRAPPA